MEILRKEGTNPILYYAGHTESSKYLSFRSTRASCGFIFLLLLASVLSFNHLSTSITTSTFIVSVHFSFFPVFSSPSIKLIRRLRCYEIRYAFLPEKLSLKNCCNCLSRLISVIAKIKKSQKIQSLYVIIKVNKYSSFLLSWYPLFFPTARKISKLL